MEANIFSRHCSDFILCMLKQQKLRKTMAADTAGKKITELRVYDLKVELEARSLETTGNKNELVKRLQQVRPFVVHHLGFFFTNDLTLWNAGINRRRY